MGDMADMIADSWGDESDAFYDDENKTRNELKCRSCKKGNLSWRRISGTWVMMEKNESIHKCEGYEPPIEALKVVADEILKKIKEETFWKLKDEAKQRGGLTKLKNIVSDEQLIDLYSSFIRDEQRNYDEPDIGMPISYYQEISMLKKEILRRMSK